MYLADSQPWFIGFSGGKDSSMVASLVFEAVQSVSACQRTKAVSIVSTDTRVELPAIEGMLGNTLRLMNDAAAQHAMNITAHLLRPAVEESFWANLIGRGYPPPNRHFRWCTQRLKIDPFIRFVEAGLGHWGQAILHLGARRSESSARARMLSRKRTVSSLRRHPDLPGILVSNPIEHLSTEEVWAYLLQKPSPWGGDNRKLYRLYAAAGGGECPVQLDTSTPSCGNSRFGCWTCTVVERDKAGEGLKANGDERMRDLLEFRAFLLEVQDPANGWRDARRTNGAKAPGPLTMRARKELLGRLLRLQDSVGFKLVGNDELLVIQRYWNSSRLPDSGTGVARLILENKGLDMRTTNGITILERLQDAVCSRRGLSTDTLRRLTEKVREYGESHRAHGLPDELIGILRDDPAMQEHLVQEESRGA